MMRCSGNNHQQARKHVALFAAHHAAIFTFSIGDKPFQQSLRVLQSTQPAKGLPPVTVPPVLVLGSIPPTTIQTNTIITKITQIMMAS
jgi:hypothetical protein